MIKDDEEHDPKEMERRIKEAKTNAIPRMWVKGTTTPHKSPKSPPSTTSNGRDNWTRSDKLKVLGIIVSVIIGIPSLYAAGFFDDFISTKPTETTNKTIETTNKTIETKKGLDNFDKINSPEHQRIVSTFENGRPFNIKWTGCSLSTELDKNENIIEYQFFMKPIILDKNDKESLIPFNTSYKFDFEATVLGQTHNSYLQHQQISKHTVTPSSGESVVLNLKSIFDQAEEIGAISVIIIMDEASLTPYSEIIDDNLLRYDDVLKTKVVTEFVHIPGKWVESNSNKESICNNLYLDLPN